MSSSIVLTLMLHFFGKSAFSSSLGKIVVQFSRTFDYPALLLIQKDEKENIDIFKEASKVHNYSEKKTNLFRICNFQYCFECIIV